MSDVSMLEPKSVFQYFDEISAVPRASKFNAKISEYLVNFAKKNNLEYYQDELGNVIIYKGATPGYETAEPVMLQGHMDMVAAVAEGYEHDFETQPLEIYVDGNYVTAAGTTLGADNGIAIAMALAVLTSDQVSHPALEVLITVDEEIGMLGAEGLDPSKISARRIINIDSESEGVITVGCAGAVDCITTFETPRVTKSGVCYKYALDGLQGGHSGMDIDKERGNAIDLTGRVFLDCLKEARMNIVSLTGGAVTNAICNKVSGEVLVHPDDCIAFEKAMREVSAELKSEYEIADPGLKITMERVGEMETEVVSDECQMNLMKYLFVIPTGVHHMSVALPGIVETSMSIGFVRLEGDTMKTGAMIRSSVDSRKKNLCQRVEMVSEAYGGKCEFSGDYGAWEFNNHSTLLDICVDTFELHFGRKPEVGAVHAGLECGKWAEKWGAIDAVSIGPEMMEVHSPNEKLSIPSTARTWEYLKAILAACK